MAKTGKEVKTNRENGTNYNKWNSIFSMKTSHLVIESVEVCREREREVFIGIQLFITRFHYREDSFNRHNKFVFRLNWILTMFWRETGFNWRRRSVTSDAPSQASRVLDIEPFTRTVCQEKIVFMSLRAEFELLDHTFP